MRVNWNTAISSALLVLAGCTHIETLPDTRITSSSEALNGAPYALPMLQYKLDVVRSLKRCQKTATVEGGRDVPSITLTDPSLVFQVKVDPTARYIPWERYTADYRALSSFLKTTSYGLETYESGTLKSINVSAEDHSGEVIKDVAATGLAIASMASGNPLLASGLMTTSVAGSSGTRGIRGGRSSGRGIDRDYAAALRSLDSLAVRRQAVICTPEAIAALDAIATNSDDTDTATAALASATNDVERYSVLANLRKARPADVAGLDAALKLQGEKALELERLTDELPGFEGAISVKTSEYWPQHSLDRETTLTLKADEAKKLEGLLEVADVRTIEPQQLQGWYQSLAGGVRAKIWDKNKDLLKPYIREDGSLLPVSPRVDTPCTASAPKVPECVADAVTITAALVHSTGTPRDCVSDGREEPRCRPTISVDKDQKIGRFAMDDQPDPGLFIRPPREALLLICRRTSGAKVDCPPARRLARLDAVPAPQLGQLRFLPFSSQAFEAGQLSLNLREDGSLEKLEYKKTKAGGTGLAATTKDVATQVQTYLGERDEKRSTALTAARAEAIASLQFEIDVLTKKAALLKAQTPESPDALAAIKSETSQIEAKTALLNAKLAQLKAEAALTQAGGE